MTTWDQPASSWADLDRKFGGNRHLGKGGLRKYLRALHKLAPRCCYCARLTVLPKSGQGTAHVGPRLASLDHLTPISRGGESRPHNLAVACTPCNTEKTDLTADEYAAYRELVAGGMARGHAYSLARNACVRNNPEGAHHGEEAQA